MIEAIQLYLAAALQISPPSIEALAMALDRLALAYGEAPCGAPADEDTEAPDHDRGAIRRLVADRFPELGFYAVVDPLAVLPETPLVGDAIDDIAEIADDLSEVLWRFTAVGADDAYWHFRFDYQTHWGRHLHDLRSYIHAKLFGLSTGRAPFGAD